MKVATNRIVLIRDNERGAGITIIVIGTIDVESIKVTIKALKENHPGAWTYQELKERLEKGHDCEVVIFDDYDKNNVFLA